MILFLKKCANFSLDGIAYWQSRLFGVIVSSMTRLINDVQENVRRFNNEEAIWRRYREKRTERRRRFRLRSRIAEKLLDQLDWIAAEREMRRSDCVGKELA